MINLTFLGNIFLFCFCQVFNSFFRLLPRSTATATEEGEDAEEEDVEGGGEA